jgi:hypothetical protein
MEDRRRVTFDNNIPLTWLISSCGTILILLATVLWNIASQSNKLDQLIIQMEKSEQLNLKRDAKLDVLMRDGFDAKKNEEIMTIRIQALERSHK